MSLRKSVLAAACIVVLGIAVPQGMAFAQTGLTEQQQEMLWHRQQGELLEQRQEPQPREPQLRADIVWNFKIVHAHTFDEIYRGTFIARNVTGPEEARWDIRRQLGFPIDSDQRTVGGVPQLIIWFEISGHGQALPPPPSPPLPSPPVPPPSPLPPVVARPAVAAELGPRRNWLSAEGSLLGGGIRYERDLTHRFTLGGNFWGEYNVPQSRFVVGGAATSRLFLGRVFYVELGLGFGLMEWEEEHWGGWGDYYWDYYSFSGPMVVPAIGFRFGGRTTPFFLNPYISLPVVLGGGTVVRVGIGLGVAW